MIKKYKSLIVVFFLFVLFFLFAKWSWNKLEQEHLITSGTITKCYWGGRGTPRYIVEAWFLINEEKINCSVPLNCQELNIDTLKAKLINIKVPIIYNPGKPWINTILLEKRVFNEYDIPIPQNLIWMTEFLDCK